MPVHNGELFVREAIDSILAQTFPHFELLIINDGSTDRSADIISAYRDSRIRLLHNSENLKLVRTLNRGLELAKGDYVARMDCDDISLPNRLRQQVEYLDTHPKVSVVGTWAKTFGQGKSTIMAMPSSPAAVRCALVFNSPIIHPSVMIRRETLVRHRLQYDEEHYAEDYGLWVNISAFAQLANIPHTLLHYRLHGASYTRKYRALQIQSVRKIHQDCFRTIGLVPTEDELEVHSHLSFSDLRAGAAMIPRSHAWLTKLRRVNSASRIWPEPAFSRCLGNRWLWACLSYSTGIVQGLWRLLQSPLAPFSFADILAQFSSHPHVYAANIWQLVKSLRR